MSTIRRTGTWYRIAARHPELSALYEEALQLGRSLNGDKPGYCAFNVWESRFEQRVAQFVGHTNAKGPDDDDTRVAEYDVARETILGLFPRCNSGCQCAEIDARMRSKPARR